ncbi:MAG: PAS domain S-box protein [Pedobacter sp.]|nr:MAG: PAS domain S-box protein [Pedobacter sp.]
MEKSVINYSFLQGGGEMGELTRNFNWAATPVGPIDSWPISLRNAVGMVLKSKFPMFLFWGEDLVQFYNDAYRPSFGDTGKHPLALGQNAVDCWQEVWGTVYSLFRKVLDEGEGVHFEDMYLPVLRNGVMEDAYWTFSYSPVWGDSGEIAGILSVCDETTQKVNNIKRLTEQAEELEFAIDATELGTWDLNPATGKFTGNARLKEWFGLQPDDEIPLTSAIEVIAERDRSRVAEAISNTLKYESGGWYDEEYTIKSPLTQTERIVKAKGRAWFDKENRPYRFNGTLQDITERITAQEEIAKVNQLTELATQSAGLGVFRVNLLTAEIEYSPAFAKIITGDAEKKEISRKTFLKYIHPDDHAERAAALEEGIATNRFTYSPRFIWDDGSVHRVVVNGSNIFDADGNAIAFSGVVRDITQEENQRQALATAEASKRSSDAMFRHVTDSSPTGLWLSDTEGHVIYMNKTICDWTGIPKEELMAGGWSRIVLEEDQRRVEETYSKSISSRSHHDVLFRLKKANGKNVWCRSGGDPYYNEDGSFAGYAGFCMDINEIMLNREALGESEERFRSMFEQAPVATCLFIGRDLRIEVANDIMLGYWGKDASIIGEPLIQAVPELIGQEFVGILDDVYTTGKTYEMTAAPVYLNKDGALRLFYFDFTYKPLFDSSGHVYGIMDMAIDVTHQVLAQQRIEENQRQILSSFEESPVAIAIIDKKDLVFTMANPFYGELVGRSSHDIVGRSLLEALPELAGQGFDHLLEQVIDTEIPYAAKEVEVDLLRNGRMEKIFVDLLYKPRYNEDDIVSGVLVVAIDVTQQVVSRQKVEDSETQLRSVVDSAPFPIGVYTGREMRIMLANQSIMDVWGKGNDIVGKLYSEVLPELGNQKIYEQLDEVYSTGKPFHARNQRVDLVVDEVLQSFYFNYSFTPLFDQSGNVYGVMNTAAEVTDLHLAKQKVEQSESNFRNIILQAPVAMCLLVGPDHIVEVANEFMINLWGKTPEQVMHKPMFEGLPDSTEQGFEKMLGDVYTTGFSFSANEMPVSLIRFGVPEVVYQNFVYEPYKDANGTVLGVLAISIDVTQQVLARHKIEEVVKQRTEELREANAGLAEANISLNHNNKQLEQFAYIVSHDLQEPVRKISIFTKMLEQDIQSLSEKQKKYFDRINTASERMGNLIRDVLRYSVLSKNNELFEMVDLNSIANDILSDLELVVEQTGANVHFDELPKIEAIPLQMSQLFLNLISNSLKYSNEGVTPEISITSQLLPKGTATFLSSDSETDYYKMVFTDNGIGFDEEYAEKIFDIFQRLHNKNEYSGTGIGLAMCKKIMQNHQGDISARPREEGGAEFTIILPVRQKAEM